MRAMVARSMGSWAPATEAKSRAAAVNFVMPQSCVASLLLVESSPGPDHDGAAAGLRGECIPLRSQLGLKLRRHGIGIRVDLHRRYFSDGHDVVDLLVAWHRDAVNEESQAAMSAPRPNGTTAGADTGHFDAVHVLHQLGRHLV